MFGDANCSGKVDVSDAVMVARFAAEDSSVRLSNIGRLNADVTHDGNIHSDDVIKILKYVAKLISADDLAH